MKVLIGDALRNAAMRFGVALDLWAKGDRADPTAENPSGSAGQANRTRRDIPAIPHVRANIKSSLPQIVPPTAQELVSLASKATTPESVRGHYATAGAQGWLKKDIAHPETAEKVTVEAYLVSRGNDLKHSKSSQPSAAGVSGSGSGK